MRIIIAIHWNLIAYDKHSCAMHRDCIRIALLMISIVVQCIRIASLMIAWLCNALGLHCL